MPENTNKNDIILALNQIATERAKQGVKVLNGSIGMMYTEEGVLPITPRVRQILSKHVKDADLVYPSVAGEAAYRENLRRWFLGNDFNQEVKDKQFFCLATIGGTGALTLSFPLSKKGNTAVVIPSLDWPNYEAIANSFGLKIEYYSLFQKRGFDLPGLKSTLEKLSSQYDALTLVINDPCENPTGYCLSVEEWHGIAEILSEKGIAKKISLVVDCAYLDYAKDTEREAMMATIKSLPKGILVYFAFSFSKTLSFYGLRIGALAIYSKEKGEAEKVFEEAKAKARAIWSVPNHMAMNVIAELLEDEKSFSELKKEVTVNREIVAKRASLFIKEAKECGLETYPYVSGFFLSIPCVDAFEVSLRLEKQNVFLAPTGIDCLRIALSSLPLTEIHGLAKTIKDAMV
jgi:aspartate/tyrosine/aromatic aminotransferase